MKKIIYTLIALAASVLLFSCRSTPEISNDLTSAQLIQLGQNAYSASDYKNAELYYKTVIQRFGMDTAVYIEAKYELGHLYVTRKNYEKAYEAFSEILELYEYAAAGDLPSAYKKLAAIGMKKIPEQKLAEFMNNSEKESKEE